MNAQDMQAALARRAPTRARRPKGPPARVVPPPCRDRVFIVAPDQHAARETVARFVEQIVAEDVEIVEQRPGRHQRLYDAAGGDGAATHAIVVLCSSDEPGAPEQSTESERLHLALGWLCATLGPHRVTLLHEAGARYPREPAGFCETTLDSAGGWMLPLLKDLSESGVAVRPDRLVGRPVT